MRWHTSMAVGLVLSATLSCGAPTDQPPVTADGSPDSPGTSTDGAGSAAGNTVLVIDDERIAESSGLARSWAHQGVFYTHNDRGSGSTLYAVDRSGTRALFDVTDAAANDWEDVASTPDRRIWIADTGDRAGTRPSVSVLVLEEPAELVTGPIASTTYDLIYPDGPHDAEALLVHPLTFRMYLVTKGRDGGAIYAAPENPSTSAPNKLERVADAPPNVTGGDFAADGARFVLRSYGRAFLYSDLATDPVSFKLPDQPQGESITFDPSDEGLLIGSEGVGSRVVKVPLPGKKIEVER